MKRSLLLFLFIFLCIVPSWEAKSFDVRENHTGFYFYGMGGMWTLDHDTNARTNLKFGSDIEGAYGLGLGYNFTNWIAPELQILYATTTGNTASGQAREHALTARLSAKVSFLTEQARRDKRLKIYPYVKLGGLAHGLFVNAPADEDKVGAYGGGLSVGGGVEMNIQAFFFALDFANDFLFLQQQTKSIAGVDTVIINGGFNYQFSLVGAIGVHF